MIRRCCRNLEETFSWKVSSFLLWSIPVWILREKCSFACGRGLKDWGTLAEKMDWNNTRLLSRHHTRLVSRPGALRNRLFLSLVWWGLTAVEGDDGDGNQTVESVSSEKVLVLKAAAAHRSTTEELDCLVWFSSELKPCPRHTTE